MSDQFTLDTGISVRLTDAEQDDELLFNSPHTMQILSTKLIAPPPGSSNTQSRYRIILSDGQYFIQAMLATQLNHMVTDEVLDKNVVIVLEKVSCNFMTNKRLIIILGLRVIGSAEDRIGEPKSINEYITAKETGAAGSSNQAPAQSTPQPIHQEAQQSKIHVQKQQPKSGRPGVLPIEALSPYQNVWTIKARCTQKSDLKTWSNQRGEGKLFNVTLMDETGEIRGTAFNAVAEDLHARFEEGKVYYISKARVNLAKKKFSNLSNSYELGFERNTEVEECTETSNLPMIKYNFVKLSELQDLAKDATCDVLAVVKEIGGVVEITSKTNKQLQKRELKLVDDTGFAIMLTLWGKQAQEYNVDEEAPVAAFKGVKIGDFGGRSLSMIGTSLMSTNPDIPEAHTLRGWYDQSGTETSFQAHTRTDGGAGSGGGFKRAELKTLAEIKALEIGDSPVYFSVQASLVHIKSENLAYPACATEGCNKKVVEDGKGWRCDKCNLVHPSPNYRYIMSLAVSDSTAQAWLQGFNEVGEEVFGMDANKLLNLKDTNEEEYNVVLHRAMHQPFNFACRAKMDNFNDQSRARYGIQKIQKLDYREETAYQLDVLSNLLSQIH